MELYDAYFGAVYRSALRVVACPDEAQEVAQDSFLKFFDRLPQYFKGGDLCVVAILRRIAINGAIDVLRRRKIEFCSLWVDMPGEDESQGECQTSSWSVEQLYAAIEQLSDALRTVITLHLIEGLDFAEIAQYLSIDQSTVRSQYTRARQRLIGIMK